jgi:Regulator of chromosome condensation (RCC1) repeat
MPVPVWAGREISTPSSSSPLSPNSPSARGTDGLTDNIEGATMFEAGTGAGARTEGSLELIQGDTDRDTDTDKERSNLTVKSVACGDFHTAALTHSGRLYVWGACSVTASGDSFPHLLPLPQAHSGLSSAKVDVTSSLGGVPSKVTYYFSADLTGCVLLNSILKLLHLLILYH